MTSSSEIEFWAAACNQSEQRPLGTRVDANLAAGSIGVRVHACGIASLPSMYSASPPRPQIVFYCLVALFGSFWLALLLRLKMHNPLAMQSIWTRLLWFLASTIVGNFFGVLSWSFRTRAVNMRFFTSDPGEAG